VSDGGRELLGQWAVVTGGSKGIGMGIAQALVGAGANVAIVARGAGDLAAGAAALEAAAGQGQRVVPIAADTGDPVALEALFDELERELPHLNVYVANAGFGVITPLLDITLDEWNRQLALNLTGTFLGVQWAARWMAKSEPESNRTILVVSSIRALGARPGRLVYSATKSALNQLVRVAALELAEHGIRVNAISPGITATPMALEQNPEVYAQMTASVPLGRSGTPGDMGAAARYLCSPAARFVTGANLVVDGGESLS
jgi:NAD(P)-dependent dehydrogenase (short-subunit alcohol dehydrogenase family)